MFLQLSTKLSSAHYKMKPVHLIEDELENFLHFVIYLSRRTPENRQLVDEFTDLRVSEISSAYEKYAGRPLKSGRIGVTQ